MKSIRSTVLGVSLSAVLFFASVASGGETIAETLRSGSTSRSLSGDAGIEKLYKIYVPSGADRLTVTTSGGWGDCDLYVRYEYWPTASTYDYRSVGKYTDEQISVVDPKSGWWGILLRGHSRFSGVTVNVSYTVDGENGGGNGGCGNQKIIQLRNNIPIRHLSDSRGSLKYAMIDVPAGAARLTVTTSGGSGDCDLFVRREKRPETKLYDAHSIGNNTSESVTVKHPKPGRWYVAMHAFRDYSGVTLLARYDEDVIIDDRTTIISPVRDDHWNAGRTHTIKWTTPKNIALVQLQYSPDNGATWSLAGLPDYVRASAGCVNWEIPNEKSITGRNSQIRIINVKTRRVLAVSERFTVKRGRIDPSPHPRPRPKPNPQPDGRADAYEPDNKSSQARTITLNSLQFHTIFPDEDEDWMVFTARRTGTYLVSFEQAVTIELKCELYTIDHKGKEKRIRKFEIERAGEAEAFTLRRGETIKLKVKAEDDDDKGAYYVTIKSLTPHRRHRR